MTSGVRRRLIVIFVGGDEGGRVTENSWHSFYFFWSTPPALSVLPDNLLAMQGRALLDSTAVDRG